MGNLDLGMGLYTTTTESVFDDYVDNLINNNITFLRVDIPIYNGATLERSKAGVIRAVAKGVKIIWGVSAPSVLTAANWGDFEAAVLDAAAWAEANGVYEFQLGNELEYINDNTTLTDAQLIINLKALATAVKLIYTRGNVSYSCWQEKIPDWITAGKGDLDILASNIYLNDTDPWRTQIDNLIAAFGVSGTYLTEFGLNSISLDTYSTDEAEQAAAIIEMIKYAENAGMEKIFFYVYVGDTFGARKEDGTYRKLWDVLKITNDWKRRKTAGQANIRGLSHG